MTTAFFDSVKIRALYTRDESPMNVWRGGTITEVSDEHQQTKMDETGKGGKGELLFWDSPANTQPRMQVYVTVQTQEREPGNPDDTGLRRVYIPKNGSAPGSIFTETANALKEANCRDGLQVGGEIYVMLTGTTASKVVGFQDRKLWRVTYRPPANQFFAAEHPAQAPAAAPQQAPAPQQQYAPPAPNGYPQQAPNGYQPPAPQQQYAPPAPPAAPQWPTTPAAAQQQHPAPQGPPATAQEQQPVTWPPNNAQGYQPPPVDPRNPFG